MRSEVASEHKNEITFITSYTGITSTRLKSMFKWGGGHLSAAELCSLQVDGHVEERSQKHHPAARLERFLAAAEYQFTMTA
jgi:hypothetical protein